MSGKAWRRLMAAVIARAMTDLENRRTERSLRASTSQRVSAMAFILSEDCESWCLELNTDYTALRDRSWALYEGGE